MPKSEIVRGSSGKKAPGIKSNFKKPHDVQLYLNSIKYKSEAGTISPAEVVRRGEANCFEGALFAAAALRQLGHRPVIVDMIAVNDDDHVIAVFRQNGLYGAVAKSNTTLLRFREPVYRTLRELVMSYFDFYFNTNGQKSLRSYSNPVDLTRFDGDSWMTTGENLDYIGDYLSTVKHHEILDARYRRALSYAEDDLIAVCFSGANEEGLYKPEV
jgi:hypothetical protein